MLQLTLSEAVEFAVTLLGQPGHDKEFDMEVVADADCFEVAAALRKVGCNVDQKPQKPRHLKVYCPAKKAS